jgi:hypothetical protein
VTEPLLHGSQVNSRPQASSRERRSEFVQPEVLRVELRALGNGAQLSMLLEGIDWRRIERTWVPEKIV